MNEWEDNSSKKNYFSYKNKVKIRGSLYEKNIIKINENPEESDNNLKLLKKDWPHTFK